ncbi:MAG: AMP-binding protein [Candidatus Woesearchaeota archaeon]
MVKTPFMLLEEKIHQFWDEDLFVCAAEDEQGNPLKFYKIKYGEFWEDVQALAAALIELKLDVGDVVYSTIKQKVPDLHKSLMLDFTLAAAGAIYVPAEEKQSRMHEIATLTQETKPRFVFVEDADAMTMLEGECDSAARVTLEKIIVMEPGEHHVHSVDPEARVQSFEALVNYGKGLLAKDPDIIARRQEVIRKEGSEINSIIYTLNGVAPADKKFPGLGVITEHASVVKMMSSYGDLVGIEPGDAVWPGVPDNHAFGRVVGSTVILNGGMFLNGSKSSHFKDMEELKGRKLYLAGVPFIWDLFARGFGRRILDLGSSYIQRRDYLDHRLMESGQAAPRNKLTAIVLALFDEFAVKSVMKRVKRKIWEGEVAIVSGGAPHNVEVVDTLRAVFGKDSYYEAFGTTACTGVTLNKPFNYISGTVGTAIEGMEVLVGELTANGIKVSGEGVEGEIFMSGDCMSPGYWQDDRATQYSIIEHAGRKWWRTGDYGRMRGEHLIFGAPQHIIVCADGKNRDPRWLEDEVKREFSLDYAICVGQGRWTMGLICGIKDLDENSFLGKIRIKKLKIDIKRHLKKLRAQMDPYRVPRNVWLVGAEEREGVREFGPLGERYNYARVHELYPDVIARLY